MANALKAAGKDVRCSDIVDRGYEGTEVLNFLSALPSDIDRNRDIITNPPYNLAQEFVEKSLNLVETGSKVAMFLRVLFLESQRRKFLFEQNPPKTVYVCSSRISCAKNGNFEKYPSSVTAYAWFVWEKGFKEDMVLKWI